MKKVVFTILVVAITVIYGIVGALLFIDIQVMKAPETTIKIDILEINAEEALIKTTLWIENPNSFTLIIKNLEVMTTTTTGNEVARVSMEGGEIAPNGNRTFTSSEHIGFDGQNPELLTSKITGTVGMKFLGIIKKTLPISVNVITSVKDVIEDIAIPICHIQCDFGEITQEGINFTGILDIYNPNSFDMHIEDFSVRIETETGENVGYLDLAGKTLAAKSSINLSGSGRILIEALNAKILTVNVSGGAGVTIAGINKSIAFSTEAKLKIPSLKDILSSDSPTEAIIRTDMKLGRRKFISYMTLELRNPNKIALVARDIVFSVYRVDGEEETLVGDCTVEEAEVGLGDTTNLSAQVDLPFSKLFFSRGNGFLPDGLLVIVRANFTIPGLDQAFLIGVSGYEDLHMFS